MSTGNKVLVLIEIFLLLGIISPSVYAADTFTIPNWLTYNDSRSDNPFLLCSEVPNTYDCMEGTEKITYRYAGDTGQLSSSSAMFENDMNIYCNMLNIEEYTEDYPPDTVEIELYHTGYCDLDGSDYPITILEYTDSGTLPEVRISFNGNISWYSTGEYYLQDAETDAGFLIQNIRETARTTYVEITCDSDAIITSTYKEVEINGSCDDLNQIDVLEWEEEKELEIGETYINYLSNLTDGNLTGNISDTLILKANMMDENGSSVPGDMNYAIRNNTGEILDKHGMPYDPEESCYIAEYMFDQDAPLGYLELNAYSPQTGYGGMMLYYLTRPYSVNLTIENMEDGNHTYFLNDQIPINLSYRNYYGEITSIDAKMKIENNNGSITSIDLPLNQSNTYHVYNIENYQPGNYTLNITIEHDSYKTVSYVKNITVQGFYLVLQTEPFWEAGDKIRFTSWVEDRRWDVPQLVYSDATFTLRTPDSDNIELITENTTGYKKTAYYETDNETEMGYYTIYVDAQDEYDYDYHEEYRFSIGGIYSNQYIEVHIPEIFDIDKKENISVDINIKNVKGQKIYNVSVEESEDVDHINISNNDSFDMVNNEERNITIDIIPADLENGYYDEVIDFKVSNTVIEMPLRFYVSFYAVPEVSNRFLDNGTFNMTAFKGMKQQEIIRIRNSGSRVLENASIHFIDSEYAQNITFLQPGISIDVNETISVPLSLYFRDEGVYNTSIFFEGSNMAPYEYNLTVNVVEGHSDSISSLGLDLADLEDELETLKENSENEDADLNLTELDRMMENATILKEEIMRTYSDPKSQTNITENLDSLGNLLDEISDELEDKTEEYERLIKPKSGDGECDPDESCSSTDCSEEPRCDTSDDETSRQNSCGDGRCSGEEECVSCPSDCTQAYCEQFTDKGESSSGSYTIIIIIFLVLLVMLVVLATSIVPDESSSVGKKDKGSGMPDLSTIMPDSINKKIDGIRSGK